jgi:hypothetical protein
MEMVELERGARGWKDESEWRVRSRYWISV